MTLLKRKPQPPHCRPPALESCLMPAQTRMLDNGLMLAFERRATAGFSVHLRLPLGSAHDPAAQEGTAGLVEEWLYKGAGERNARQFQDAQDDLGMRRGGGLDAEATYFSGSGLTEDLRGTLGLFADLLRRPHLPDSELPVLIDLARQDLEGMQDNPAECLSLEARRVIFGTSGYAHPTSGTLEGLSNVTADSARAFWQSYAARGSIISVVADVEADTVFGWIEELFGDWQAGNAVPVLLRPHLGKHSHVVSDSQQTYFTLTGLGVSPFSQDWFAWHLALTALSSGSASRLFHAVREERGLAYSVTAGSQLIGGEGFFSAEAASTPQRAPETLEVMLSEIERWQGGITPAEFERAQNALLTNTVFSSESIRARSGGMARDLALFGRVREASDLRGDLSKLTLARVNAFLQSYDSGPLGLVSLGQLPLSMPSTVLSQTAKGAAHV